MGQKIEDTERPTGDADQPTSFATSSMIYKLFREQRTYIDHFFTSLDLGQVELFIRECLDCSGLLTFTGVGKSGLVAEKIAMTLVSTGTKALYLPPTNFLHGDLGILSDRDRLILLSKSGETEELLELLPLMRNRKVRLLAIVSSESSRLAKASDVSLTLPVARELCPFDLAPTTSTAVQMLFGDLLAVFLMQAKGFSLETYALNHPAGAIGKKIALSIDDIMLKNDRIPLCTPDARLIDVLVELSNKQCGCLLIADDSQHLLGIFTDGDLRRALQCFGAAVLYKPIDKLMTSSPIGFPKGMLAIDALKQMQKDPKRWIQVAPVLDGLRIIGIIRMHDIIQRGLSL